jgi:hypothetical protein
MTGSYLIMDGGLRDARANVQPDAAVVQEMQRIAGRGAERRARHQVLIDDRD